jgi:hypothetical protein
MAIDPAKCPHPYKKRETPILWHTRCKRCADLTPPERQFEYRHGPATTFRQGDRIRVKGTQLMSAYTAKFWWAEETKLGVRYFVGELQTYKDGTGRHVEGIAAHRMADPELVRTAPGVRDRKAREAMSE